MDALTTTHLLLICLWGGVVLAEVILERLFGSEEASLPQLARAHYWIDVLVELPLLLGVIASGGWLLIRTWPPSLLLSLKIGLASIGLLSNLVCVVYVIQRHRRRRDPEAVRALTRAVELTGLGIPFALGAAYLGLAYFH
ncbi:MAG: hypothetical protein OEY14_11600 [Myxococcales bacterium]|nr:hypothetical protein [Myxococcales bacterium]